MRQVNVVIAGVRIGLDFGRDISPILPDRSFLENGNSDIRFSVRFGETPPPMRENHQVFDSGQIWALFESEGKWVIQNDTLGSGSAPHAFFVLEPDFKSGEIFLGSALAKENLLPDPLPYPLNQVLMILLLSKGRGLLVHGCGIDDHGEGYLFLGNSGDGKSTTAKLWYDQRMAVLNDDRIILREKDGEFWMYGTPWNGDFKEHSARGMAVRKLFFLRHGQENLIGIKSGAEAVSMVLTRSFPPFWDKEGMAFTIEFCQNMTGKVPCYELTFVPNAGMIDFVRSI
jgi:hypothetical protein